MLQTLVTDGVTLNFNQRGRVPLIPSCTFGKPNFTSLFILVSPSSGGFLRSFSIRTSFSRLISDAFLSIASLSKGDQCILLVSEKRLYL